MTKPYDTSALHTHPAHVGLREQLLQSAGVVSARPATGPHLGTITRPVRITISHGQNEPNAPRYLAVAHIPAHRSVEGLLGTDEQELSKATNKKLPSNGSWVTVHPGGEGKGSPVYLVPNADGSHTIVAGAGGKLNGLKLTKVKSKEEYAQHGKVRSEQARDQKRQQVEETKAQVGEQQYKELVASHKAQLAHHEAHVKEREKEFVRGVLAKQGLDPDQLMALPEDVAKGDTALRDRVEREHHAKLVSYAEGVVKDAQTKLLRAIPTITASDGANASMLIKDALFGDSAGGSGKLPGYRIDRETVLAAHGIPAEQIDSEAGDAAHQDMVRREGSGDAATDATEKRTKLNQAVAKTRARVREAMDDALRSGVGARVASQLAPDAKVVTARDAVELLTAHSELESARDGLRGLRGEGVMGEVSRRVAEAGKVPGASPLVVKDIEDAGSIKHSPRGGVTHPDTGKAYRAGQFIPATTIDALVTQAGALANTNAVASLVTASNDMQKSGSLYRYLSQGRFEGLAENIAKAMPDMVIDPLLIDTIGVRGAAAVAVHTMKSRLSPDEFAQVAGAVQQDHVASQKQIADDAVAKSQALMDSAKVYQPDLSGSQTAQSIAASMADIASARRLSGMARETIGTAQGRLEAAAAMNHAFMGGDLDGVQYAIPGATTVKDGIERIRAVSPFLKMAERDPQTGDIVSENDFEVQSPQGGTVILSLTRSGLQKLVPAEDPELLARIKQSNDIRGAEPEPGYLPAGMRKIVGGGAAAGAQDSPIMGAAKTAYGDLTDEQHDLIRKYGIERLLGVDPLKDQIPATSLSPEQGKAWSAYQEAVIAGHGDPYPVIQEKLQSLGDIASLDLGDDAAVLSFARSNGAMLGYVPTEDGSGNSSYPQLIPGHGADDHAQAQDARERAQGLLRTTFATQVGGLNESFDPQSVPATSPAWAQLVQQQGGDAKAVEAVQKAIQSDPDIVMSEGKPLRFSPQQERATKMIVANRRQAIGLQAGGGKTNTVLGSFADAHSRGEAKRALMVIPSAILKQFGGEFEKFVDTEQTGLNCWSKPGASSKERDTQYSGKSGHSAVIVTPETLRDDVLRYVGQDIDLQGDGLREAIKGMDESELDKLVHGALQKRGVDFDYFAFDEGHRLLDRDGKEDSVMALIGDSVGRLPRSDGQLPMYAYLTADPIKNDLSEMHSVLHKVDPVRYPKDSADEFKRKYDRSGTGQLTEATAQALLREISPFVHTEKADIGATHERSVVKIKLTPAQSKAHDAVLDAYGRARAARALGRIDSEAEGILGADDPSTFAIARDAALARIVNADPQGGKANWVMENVAKYPGEPMVVFSHDVEAAKSIASRLSSSGVRASLFTGSMSGSAKDRARLAFQGGGTDGAEPQADILVCTDAAEAGLNLQRGHHLINVDVPITAKTHEQRIAREWRRGQASHVKVSDLVGDCSWDARNRERLERKGALRELITSPAEIMDDTGLAMQITRRRLGA